MAIRFVDVGSEKAGEAKPAPARRARAPEAAPEAAPEVPEDAPSAEAAPDLDGEASLPTLPHAKPEPKPRGRKKPMSAAGADRSKAPDAPAAPLLEGLLPELQAHAKPTPKPRGRKKAFG